MKKILVAAAALALAACAVADKPASRSAATAQPAGTYYCWKDKLVTQGDGLMCNWEADRKTACDTTYPTTMARSQVATGPTDAGRCENGQWLVMITKR